MSDSAHRPEPGRPEPGRPEPGRPEPGRPAPRLEPDRPEPRRLDPAGLVVGVVIPLVLVTVGAIWLAARWDELPAQFPSHWGPGGEADSWAPPGEAIGMPVAVILVSVLPLTVLAAFARVDRLLRRAMLVVGMAILGMFGPLMLLPVSSVLAGESDPSVSGWEAAVGSAVGLIVGAVGAALLVDGRRREPAETTPSPSLPRAPLAELEYTLRLSTTFRVVILVALVGAAAVCAVALPGMGVAVALIMLPLLVMLAPFRVRVDAQGLHVRQARLEVLRVDAHEIASAEPGRLDPWAHGGAGYRITDKGVLLATRKGAGVTIATGSGRTVRLETPASDVSGGAATASDRAASDLSTAQHVAGILNAAADRAR